MCPSVLKHIIYKTYYNTQAQPAFYVSVVGSSICSSIYLVISLTYFLFFFIEQMRPYTNCVICVGSTG